MTHYLQLILRSFLLPKYIFPLAIVVSFGYLCLYKFQGRFEKTTLSDFISTGFQVSSICGGTKLVLRILLQLAEMQTPTMEMDKFYTGYGGAAVVWISLVTLKKRFKKPEHIA